MKVKGQLIRLLGLVPYLRARPGVSVAEAAAAFQITPGQLISDLGSLWMCGLPGGLPDDLIDIDMDAVKEKGIIHLANADYLARPMKLGPDEVLGLVVALRLLDEIAPGESRPAVSSALEKLTGLLDGWPVPVEVEVVSGDDSIREQLIAAIERAERIQLTYHGPRRTTVPIVDPVRVDLVDGYLYLRAWSPAADGWRTYRLDRIAQLVPTGEGTTDHGEPPAEERWFAEAPEELILRLRPAAHWVCEYFPASALERDGSDLIITLPVAAESWAVALILRLGDDATLIAPGSVADAVRAEARATLEQYAALGRVAG